MILFLDFVMWKRVMAVYIVIVLGVCFILSIYNDRKFKKKGYKCRLIAASAKHVIILVNNVTHAALHIRILRSLCLLSTSNVPPQYDVDVHETVWSCFRIDNDIVFYDLTSSKRAAIYYCLSHMLFYN